MSEILDLDALLPEPKKVKLSGKILDVYPPTVRQLLRLQRIGQSISDQSLSGEEAEKGMMEALSTIIPALKDDDTIDINLDQMLALIDFLQKSSVPKNEAAKEFAVEKKTESSEQ